MVRDDKSLAAENPRMLKICGDRSDPCSRCQEIAPVRVVRSEELMQGERELFIVHEQQVYRLLRTRNNKLILQK